MKRKRKEFYLGQRKHLVGGGVVLDESDEILIRTQEWKFLRTSFLSSL